MKDYSDHGAAGFAGVVAALGIGPLPDCWQRQWGESQASYPPEGVDFLRDEYLLAANETLNLPANQLEALMDVLAVLRAGPALSRFAWHCHRVLFHTPGYPREFVGSWPLLQAALGDQAHLYTVVICISALPEMTAFYQAKAIPLEILKDTLSQVCENMKGFFEDSTHWRHDFFLWFIFHFKGMLFKLGRLQFVYSQFRAGMCVFRHRDSREIVALAHGGIKFREDGQIDGTSGVYAKEGWLSRLTQGDGFVEGNPILPTGRAEKRKLRLALDQWTQVLNKADPILEVHIPGGSRLTHDLCLQSYAMAADFYAKFFPDKNYAAFTCESWLMDNQFEQLLPPSSNIVQFQRDYFLYPIVGEEDEAFGSVFGKRPKDLSQAPRDTLLQRVILDHVSAGNPMRSGGGFILKDSLS